MWMSITWITCWMWQIHYTYRVNYQIIVLTIMWIFFAFVPLARLRNMRKEFLSVGLNTLIAPFGAIDFLHLSWGSVNTNMNVPYIDSVAVLCLYTSNQLATPCPVPCLWQAKFIILFRFITIFSRGMQNGRRYHNSGYTFH